MSQLLKWIVFYALLFMTHTGIGWTIGSKTRVNGPSIHTTYFLTPSNSSVPVRAYAYLGTFVNGECVYHSAYNIGRTLLKTGDTVDIDAFQLKEIAGTGYNCMTIDYIAMRSAIETFLLEYNGFNYINTFPATAEVNIT